MNKRNLVLPVVLGLATTLYAEEKKEKTNFIVIFCDDLGYGDLACFGNPSIKTPNLDKMAEEGQRWSNFYASASVSSPSRGGLLTGKYGVRTGLYGNDRRVLFPDSPEAISSSDNHTTMANIFQNEGYTTACVGKWHLGHKPEDMPLEYGFDKYYGIPYSNDMSLAALETLGDNGYNFPLPFYNQDKVIEIEPDQSQFTKRLTDYSVSFIKENKDKPFFLYLAHIMTHVPIYSSKQFDGKSKRGPYGDAVEELDWSLGEIMKTLRKQGLDENTVVIFTSDNGPWLIQKEMGGSAGPFRDGKSTMYEGGFKIPTIFWGQGVKSDHVVKMGSTLDILPTLCDYANIKLDKNEEYDGVSLRKVLEGKDDTPRDIFYYYKGSQIFAVRKGSYKLFVKTERSYMMNNYNFKEPPLLYNIDQDASEKHDIYDKHPEIVKELEELIAKRQAEVVPVRSIFDQPLIPKEEVDAYINSLMK
ncbi:MAG: sulfatase [Rikenellaceae bacterium]